MNKKIAKQIPELRRSARERKQPKDDEYWRGLPNQFAWFGTDMSNDQVFPKRRRRNRYDSEDYEGGHHRSFKKRDVNPNKIQALLEWRYHIEEQQLKIITDEDVDNLTGKCPPLSKEKISKNIVGQKLQDIAQNVEATFINIDWGKKGQTLQDFEKLKIQSTKFMSKGIVFLWTPKNMVAQILSIMTKKDFFYVENFEVINFDREKAIQLYCPGIRKASSSNKGKSENTLSTDGLSESQQQLKQIIKNLQGIEPNDLILQAKSEFFNISKKTLLMFRKSSTQKLELRHQRTCDVIFDMPSNPLGKCQPDIKKYIYNMIETLLPESLIIEYKNKTELGFKLVQLWGDKGTQRRGWINISQQ